MSLRFTEVGKLDSPSTVTFRVFMANCDAAGKLSVEIKFRPDKRGLTILLVRSSADDVSLVEVLEGGEEGAAAAVAFASEDMVMLIDASYVVGASWCRYWEV